MGKKKKGKDEVDLSEEKQLIAELFLKPLLLHKPENKPVIDFLRDDIFHLKTRHLETFRVLENFYLSGHIKKGYSQIQGRVNIKKGNRIVVRTDDTQPDIVEVSVMEKGEEVVAVVEAWVWATQRKRVKSMEKDNYSVPQSYRPPPRREPL